MTGIAVTVTALETASEETKELVANEGPQFKYDSVSGLFASIRHNWFGSLPISELYIENVPGQVEPVSDYQELGGKFKTSEGSDEHE